jgi:hypothetical protein
MAASTPTRARSTTPITLLAVLLALGQALGCQHELYDEDGEEPFDDRTNELLQGVYDCTERADNGYRGGSRFAIKVVRVDDRPVEVNTANAYIAMQSAARRDGVNLRIVSGFRTQAEQQRLYNCYVNCNCNNCNLAARPGYSNHQSGHALDLNTRDAGVQNWLNRNGSRFGFSRTVPSEPWHWEWWGRESDYAGPCGGNAAPPAQCDSVPTSGGLIEEDDGCGGGLIWTGATANANAINWGQWNLNLQTAGRYELQVYIDSLATSRQTRYSVRHNGTVSTVTVDQANRRGFVSLGTFDFAAGGNQRVFVGDNTGEASSQRRVIVLDALRVIPANTSAPPPANPPPQASCTRVQVRTSGAPLNVRPTASTAQAPRGTLNNGEVVDRLRTVEGQSISGNTRWYEVRRNSLQGFVSAAYATCVN